MAAEEWQLSWTAEGLPARQLLSQLRVNPTSFLQQQADAVAPLAVPLTLAVEAQTLTVSLLGAAAAASEPERLQELGSLECAGLKVC